MTIKITEELLDAFNCADFSRAGNADWENEHIRIGLKAVFAELDKVENQTYLRGYGDGYAAGVKDASE